MCVLGRILLTVRDSHVVYTIPIALLLSVVLAPLLTRLDLYKIVFLVTVAFAYTLPWYVYQLGT